MFLVMANTKNTAEATSNPGSNVQTNGNGKTINPNVLTWEDGSSGNPTKNWQDYIKDNFSAPTNFSISTNFSDPSASTSGVLEQTKKNNAALITLDSGSTSDLRFHPDRRYRLSGWYGTTENYVGSDAMFNAIYDLKHDVDDPTLFPIKTLSITSSLSIDKEFKFPGKITNIKLIERVYTGEANYPKSPQYQGNDLTNTTQWNTATPLWNWDSGGSTDPLATIPVENVAHDENTDVLAITSFKDEDGNAYESYQIWNANTLGTNQQAPTSSKTFVERSLNPGDQAIKMVKKWLTVADIIHLNPTLQGLTKADQPIDQINVYQKIPSSTDWGTATHNISKNSIYNNIHYPEIQLPQNSINFKGNDIKIVVDYVGSDGLNYVSTAFYNAGSGTDLRGGNDFVTPDSFYSSRDLKIGSGLGHLIDHRQTNQNGQPIWWEKRYVDFSIPDDQGELQWYIGKGALGPNSQSTQQQGSRLYADLELYQWAINENPQDLAVLSIDPATTNAEEGGEPGKFVINVARNETEAKKNPSEYQGTIRQLFVPYEITSNSTATRGVDYYAPKTSRVDVCNSENMINIKPGSGKVDIYIPAVEDAIAEGNESVEIRLIQDGYNYTSGCDAGQEEVEENLFLGPNYTIKNSNATLQITDRQDNSPKNLFAVKFNPINLYGGLNLTNNATPQNNIIFAPDFSKPPSSAGNKIIAMENPGSSQNVLEQTPTVAAANNSVVPSTKFIIEPSSTSELIAGQKYILSGWYARSSDYQKSDKMFYSQINGKDVLSPAGIGKLQEVKTINGITWEKRYQEITVPDNYSSFQWMVGESEDETFSSPQAAAYESQAVGKRYYADLKIQKASPTALLQKPKITTLSLAPFGDSIVNGTTTQDESIIDSPAGGVPLKMTTTASNDNSPAETYTQTFGLSSAELEDRKVWNIAEVNKGETYTFSVWAKADKKNTAASITLLEANEQGEALISTNFPNVIKADDSTNTNIKDKSIKLSTRWKRFSVTKTIENDLSKNIQVKLSGLPSSESRSLWWDGIQVEKNTGPTSFIDHKSVYPFLPGISITPANRKGATPVRAQNISNNKEEASFNISIDSQPREDVTVSLSASFINNPTANNAIPTSSGTIVDSNDEPITTLTFNANNWENPQQVSLTDIQQDPNKLTAIKLTATSNSNDNFYSNSSGLKANQLIYPADSTDLRNISLWENKPQSTLIPKASVNTISGEEGETVGFRFSLSKPNKTDTTINFDLSTSADLNSTDIENLTLPQSIIIPAKKRTAILNFKSIDDEIAEGVEFLHVKLKKSSQPNSYSVSSKNNDTKSIIKDNDIPGIEFVVQRTIPTTTSSSASGSTTGTQGSNKTIWVPIDKFNIAEDACPPYKYTIGVRLTSEIRSTVAVTPSKNGLANITFDKTPLTFDTNQKPWNEPQTIEITFDPDQSNSEGNLDALIFETEENDAEPFYSQLEADLPIILIDKDTPITTDADVAGDNDGVESQDPNTPIAVLKQDTNKIINEAEEDEASPDSSTFTVKLKEEPYTSTNWNDFKAEEETVIFFEPSQQSTDGKMWPISYDITIPDNNYLSGLQRYINDGGNQQAATPSSSGSTENPFDISDLLQSLAGSEQTVSWGGYLYLPESGNYDFKLTVTGGASLTVGGDVMIDQIDANVNTTLLNSTPFVGVAGEFVPFKLEYNPNGNQTPQIDLEWVRPIELNTDTDEENIPSRYLSRIGAWHVVIPEGMSSASFDIKAIQDKIAKPQQEIDIKLLRDRTDLLDVSLPQNNANNAKSLTIKLDETSSRESLVLSSNASNDVVDSVAASSTTSTVNKNSLELNLSTLGDKDKNPENTVTLDLDKNPKTIYKGETEEFTYTENYEGDFATNLNANTPKQYQLIDDVIDIKIKNNLIPQNPLGITLSNITASSDAITYTGTITRKDQLAKSVTILQGQEITLVTPDDAAGGEQVAITINVSEDVTLNDSSNQSQVINFTIPNEIDKEDVNTLNNQNLEASLKSYEAFFEIGSTDHINGIIPKGTSLRFTQDTPEQKCTTNPPPTAKPFSLVVVDELAEGSDMEEAGMTVIDFSEAQQDLSQTLNVDVSKPVAHYQFPESGETGETSTLGTLNIKDNRNAEVVYSELINGDYDPINPANAIQLQENGISQTRYIALSSQPTEGVTVYLETNDASEVAIQKDYDFIKDVNITINANTNNLRTRKPPRSSNEDFLQEAILKMDSRPRIKGFTVAYENNNSNGNIEEIEYITTNKYTVEKVAADSSKPVRLFANPEKLQSIRDNLGLEIVEEQFSPESLVAFTFTPDNWNTQQPFTLTPIDDIIDDETQTVNIFHQVSSQDTEYQKLTNDSSNQDENLILTIKNSDDDTAGVIVNPITQIQESSNGEVEISLNTKPTDNVTLTLTPSDSQFKIGHNTLRQAEFLTFTPDNYDIKQSIELTAVNDKNVEDITKSELQITSQSADANFDAEYLQIDPVVVEIIDDDVPTASIEFVNDGTEGAEPGNFRVKLSNPAPSAAGSNGIVVNYSVQLLDEDGQPNPPITALQAPSATGSVRIPPGQLQSEVFVVPIDDLEASPGVSYKINLLDSSATGPTEDKYQLGEGSQSVNNSVTVKIINNDIAGFTLVYQGDDISVEENGENTEFYLMLNSQPENNVTVELSEQELNHNSKNVPQLIGQTQANKFNVSETFTRNNWFIPRSITFGALRDYILEDGEMLFSGQDNEELKLVTYGDTGNPITDSDSVQGTIQNDGIHPAAIKFKFTSDDPCYSSTLIGTCTTVKDPSFVNHIQNIRVLDETLPEEAKGVINTSFISLQDQVNDIALPMIGKSDQKTGENIYSLIHGLTDKLSNARAITPAAIKELLTQELVEHLDMKVPTNPTQQLVAVTLDKTSQTKDINIVLELDSTETGFDIPLDANLGNPSLGIQSEGILNTDLAISGQLSFGIPLKSGSLPYLKTGENEAGEKDTYLQAQITSALSDDFKLTGGLGFLEIEGTNATSARFANNSETQLQATVKAFPDPGQGTLNFSQLLSAINNPLNLGKLISFEVDPQSKAQFSFDVQTSVNGSSAMPSFNFKMASEFPFTQSNNEQILYIDDVKLDLGSFVTGIAGPSISQVDSILEPIYPILDALYADTQLFGKIGLTDYFDQNNDNQVSMMDLVEWFTNLSPSARSSRTRKLQEAHDFIDNINNISTVIREIEQLRNSGQNFEIAFPSYEFSASNFNANEGNTQALSKNSATTLPTAPITQAKKASNANSFSSIMNKLSPMGITIPLLDKEEYMETVSNLITGDTTELMKWTLSSSDPSVPSAKSLNVESSVNKSFPIWGPISGLIEGGFNATTDLSFGFDTSGMQQWKDDNFKPASAWKVFNGFYVDDEQGNIDIDEFKLDANMGAGAGLSAFVARASVTGGLEAGAGLNLLDVGEISNTSDGKIYADEISSRIENPLTLFNIVGELAAYLEAKVQVGIDAWLFSYWKTVWEKRLATIPIFRFGIGGSYGNGTVSNGHIDGSTVFFDSNSNGRVDYQEPKIITNESSKHSLYIDHRRFDKNFDGSINNHEGRLIAIGGTDTTTNLEVRIPMVGAIDSNMVSPLTTLQTFALAKGNNNEEVNKRLQLLFGMGEFQFHEKDPLRQIKKAKTIGKPKHKDAVATYLAHSKIHFTLDLLSNSLTHLSDEFLGSTEEQLDMIDALTESLLRQPEQSPFLHSIRFAIIETIESIFKKPASQLPDELIDVATFTGEAAIEFAAKLDALSKGKSLTLDKIHALKTKAFHHYRENILGLSDGLHRKSNPASTIKAIRNRLSNAHGDFIQVTTNNNFVLGTNKNNVLNGGSGADVLSGMNGLDSLNGGSGDDHLKGGKDNDFIEGGSHQDLLEGQAGLDTLQGGKGDDTVFGGKGDDRLLGMSGNDHLIGEAHHDHLSGKSGDDILEGQRGIDTLNGGSGDDLLTGGAGKDLFILSEGADTITDFKLRKGRGDQLEIKTDVPLSFMQNGDDLTIQSEDGINTTLLGINKESFLKHAQFI